LQDLNESILQMSKLKEGGYTNRHGKMQQTQEVFPKQTRN